MKQLRGIHRIGEHAAELEVGDASSRARRRRSRTASSVASSSSARASSNSSRAVGEIRCRAPSACRRRPRAPSSPCRAPARAAGRPRSSGLRARARPRRAAPPSHRSQRYLRSSAARVAQVRERVGDLVELFGFHGEPSAQTRIIRVAIVPGAPRARRARASLPLQPASMALSCAPSRAVAGALPGDRHAHPLRQQGARRRRRRACPATRRCSGSCATTSS